MLAIPLILVNTDNKVSACDFLPENFVANVDTGGSAD
jgi:hypothetical protein